MHRLYVSGVAYVSHTLNYRKMLGSALVCRFNANATLCQIVVSENVEVPKEKVSNNFGLVLYRVRGMGLELTTSTILSRAQESVFLEQFDGCADEYRQPCKVVRGLISD